jgi:hypothetical protein
LSQSRQLHRFFGLYCEALKQALPGFLRVEIRQEVKGGVPKIPERNIPQGTNPTTTTQQKETKHTADATTIAGRGDASG